MTPPLSKKVDFRFGLAYVKRYRTQTLRMPNKMFTLQCRQAIAANLVRWSTSEKSGVFLFVSEIDTPGVIF